MAGGKKSDKSSKKQEEKTQEKVVFHDCESDGDLVQSQNARQGDLSLIAQNLDDPNAFHKNLQAIVSTTQQLLCKFDSHFKSASKRYRKRTHRRTANVSDSERSVRLTNSMLCEIHMRPQVQSSNMTYHQVSTRNENMFQVLKPQPAMGQMCYNSQQLLNNKSVEILGKPSECDDKRKQQCTAGDNKNIFKTKSQTSISEKSIYATPKTSCFSILTSSQLDIELLHSQSKLLRLQQRKSKKSSQSTQPFEFSKTSKQSQKCEEETPELGFNSCTSMLNRASNTLRGAGASILFQGKRFMSSISSYMGGYVDGPEQTTSQTSKVSKRRSLSPKASRTKQQKSRRKRKGLMVSNQQMNCSQQFSTMAQFALPPELAALAANGKTMPAILMFMPPPQDASNSQQQQLVPIQAMCIPIMPQTDQAERNLHSTSSNTNTNCSSATQVQPLIDICRRTAPQFDLNAEPFPPSCTSLPSEKSDKTFVATHLDPSCGCSTELQDQCASVTHLNEDRAKLSEYELECCASDVTLVAPPSTHNLTCCARSKRENCVECVNITSYESKLKPEKKNFEKYKKDCRCGLRYPDRLKAKGPCTCNTDGQLNEDCKLPACIEKFGVCGCDCANTESIEKCCKEAFQETCICTDYSIPKLYRLALPQHKDLNLCIKCRFDPSPLIDEEGKVFCPGECGCCLCPWQPRASMSKQNLMLHEKVRVCVCRDRGTLFNLSPKNSKCNNPGDFDLCPCRERAEAKFLELYEKEMFKIDPKELNQISGPPVTLKDVQEVITVKEKQKLPTKRNKL